MDLSHPKYHPYLYNTNVVEIGTSNMLYEILCLTYQTSNIYFNNERPFTVNLCWSVIKKRLLTIQISLFVRLCVIIIIFINILYYKYICQETEDFEGAMAPRARAWIRPYPHLLP